MQQFSRLVVKFNKFIMGIVILLTLMFIYFMKDCKLDDDVIGYLPKDDPDVCLFEEIGEKFGGTSIAMIAVQSDDIFTYETLSKVRRLTREFENIDGVSTVMSLTNIIKIRGEEGYFEIADLIDDIPVDKEELQELRKKVLSKDMYVGSLVSEDGGTTVIMCRIKKDADCDFIGGSRSLLQF